MNTLEQQHYTDSFLVDQSPAEVFAAVNNVRGWWAGEINGSTNKLGAEFTYRYKDLHQNRRRMPLASSHGEECGVPFLGQGIGVPLPIDTFFQ